jgi:hypothetical protein
MVLAPRRQAVLVVFFLLTTASCTASNGSDSTGSSVTVLDGQGSETTALQFVPTSLVYDFEGIDIDDFYRWAEVPSEWDAFLAVAETNCRTTVVALSTMAGVLTAQLDKTLIVVKAGVNGEVPAGNVVEAMARFESVLSVGAKSADYLSQRASIENAHAYTVLLGEAFAVLQPQVRGLGFAVVDAETNTLWAESIAERILRVEAAGELVSDLVYRPPEWECLQLRP